MTNWITVHSRDVNGLPVTERYPIRARRWDVRNDLDWSEPKGNAARSAACTGSAQAQGVTDRRDGQECDCELPRREDCADQLGCYWREQRLFHALDLNEAALEQAWQTLADCVALTADVKPPGFSNG